MENSETNRIGNYHRGVRDWALSCPQSYYNNALPRPFPAVPTKIDDDGNDTGNPAIDKADVKIVFREAMVDGKKRLVILVPTEAEVS